MNKVFKCNIEAGSKMNEPKLTSEALNECLNSNEPLAKAFRQWVAEHEAAKQTDETGKSCRRFRGFYPNTEPCVDLKLMTCKPGRMEVGDLLGGVITRDGEEHYTFRETQPSTAGKRNQQVFYGKFITITRRDDGTLRPNFKPLKMEKGFSASSYATGVANELLWALTSLLGK